MRSGLIKKKAFVINGKSIILTNLNQSNILQGIALNGFESYENEVVTLIKNYPWEMCVFYDVGANIGYYSILTELYHPKTKVVAIEPFPKNIEYIKRIRKLNNLNYELIEAAIDRSSGERRVFYYPTTSSSSKLAASGSLINSFKGTKGVYNNLPYETVEITTTSLSSVVAQHDGSCLIKLDCEGNELSILESSTDVLGRSDVDYIVEIMINDQDKNDVFSLMQRNGYKGFLITNAGLVYEDRPLTFPYPDRRNRTIWKNHFFTKRDISEIRDISEKCYGCWI
jgi:FkbM family methyltransferase